LYGLLEEHKLEMLWVGMEASGYDDTRLLIDLSMEEQTILFDDLGVKAFGQKARVRKIILALRDKNWGDARSDREWVKVSPPRTESKAPEPQYSASAHPFVLGPQGQQGQQGQQGPQGQMGQQVQQGQHTELDAECLDFLQQSGLGKLAVRLKSMGIYTMADMVRVGADEIGAVCKLKVGPKVKLEQLIAQRLPKVEVVASAPASTQVAEDLNRFLLENGFGAMVSKLEGLGVLTMADLVRHGANEIGQMCGMKLGPKMKLEKVLKKWSAGAAADNAVPSAVVEPLKPDPLSADLQTVRDYWPVIRNLKPFFLL
jgi:hypothetical protein